MQEVASFGRSQAPHWNTNEERTQSHRKPPTRTPGGAPTMLDIHHWTHRGYEKLWASKPVGSLGSINSGAADWSADLKGQIRATAESRSVLLISWELVKSEGISDKLHSSLIYVQSFTQISQKKTCYDVISDATRNHFIACEWEQKGAARVNSALTIYLLNIC